MCNKDIEDTLEDVVLACNIIYESGKERQRD